MHRESRGMYSIIVNGKKGYRNHPATQEFIDCPEQLYEILVQLKAESVRRGYNFKELPPRVSFGGQRKSWQSLSEQIEVLKSKECECRV